MCHILSYTWRLDSYELEIWKWKVQVKIYFSRLKCNEYYKNTVMMIMCIQTVRLLHHWTALKLEMTTGYELNLLAIKDQKTFRSSRENLVQLFLLIVLLFRQPFTMRCDLILSLIISLHVLIIALESTSITRHHHHHKIKKRGSMSDCIMFANMFKSRFEGVSRRNEKVLLHISSNGNDSKTINL